jgi:hypothetical protein
MQKGLSRIDGFNHKSITGKEAIECEIVTMDGFGNRSDFSNGSFCKMEICRFATFSERVFVISFHRFWGFGGRQSL